MQYIVYLISEKLKPDISYQSSIHWQTFFIILQESKGLLSTLVEEEVGLWTTDLGDGGTSSKVGRLLWFFSS